MKISLTISIIFTIFYSAFSQTPQSFGYQAIARNNNGKVITDQNVSMRISILQGNVTGVSVYTETHTTFTDAYGIINLAIGAGTKESGDLSGINWAIGPYFVKIEMDVSGGNNYVFMGTSQLLSVPYALYAGNVNLQKNSVAQELYIKDDGTIIAIPKISVEYPYSAVPFITDLDGNIYKTVKIGTQIWMAENLKTTKYNDNTAIPLAVDEAAWNALKSPGFCTYNNTNSTDTINKYGRLYNWYAINTSKLCPTGWHIPSDDEWTILSTYLGSLDGGRLKETGTMHWKPSNVDAINDSKFSALPGGYRMYNGEFKHMSSDGFYWSSTLFAKNHPWHKHFSWGIGITYKKYEINFHEVIYGDPYDFKNYALSVRCIMD